MTDEKYVEQFLKEGSLFIAIRMNGSLVVRRVLQDYIPGEEYIYIEVTEPGSKPYNSRVGYTALANNYKEPIIFIVKEEY